MGKSARRKGHDFEREVVRKIREKFKENNLDELYIVRRGLQSRGGSEAADVEIIYKKSNRCEIHIECKAQKMPNIRAAFRQADEEKNTFSIPVAITKKDRDEKLVTISFDWWLNILVATLLLRNLDSQWKQECAPESI